MPGNRGVNQTRVSDCSPDGIHGAGKKETRPGESSSPGAGSVLPACPKMTGNPYYRGFMNGHIESGLYMLIEDLSV